MSTNTVKFFSYVVKENVEGIRALLGRRKLLYEEAEIEGYELCIQRVDQVLDKVPQSSPINISPRTLLLKTYSPEYELYTIRPCIGSSVPGKIWYISPEEYAIWREYELIDYGLQRDINVQAVTDSGDTINVLSYAALPEVADMLQAIDPGYIRESIPTRKKLQHKRQIRLDYISRLNQES